MLDDLNETCPWGQCSHLPNAHSRDHCLACDCVKPPPPPPAAPQPTEELETIEAETCGVCSAYVADRGKHLAVVHERPLETLTNLVMSLGALERRIERLQAQIGALDRANAEIDRRLNPKPEF